MLLINRPPKIYASRSSPFFFNYETEIICSEKKSAHELLPVVLYWESGSVEKKILEASRGAVSRTLASFYLIVFSISVNIPKTL